MFCGNDKEIKAVWQPSDELVELALGNVIKILLEASYMRVVSSSNMGKFVNAKYCLLLLPAPPAPPAKETSVVVIVGEL